MSDPQDAINKPAFRSLDGVELALPVDGDRWVLVPRGLSRDEPDLIWALEYEDVPLAPQLRDELGGDPWLDYSDGALLVPIARWNARAAVEPALVGGCAVASPIIRESRYPAPFLGAARPSRRDAAHAARLSAGAITRVGRSTWSAARSLVDGIALVLAMSFAVAVGEWIVALRNGISGAELGNGAILLPSALALAALSRWMCFGTLGRAAFAILRAGATIVGLVFAAFLLGLGS